MVKVFKVPDSDNFLQEQSNVSFDTAKVQQKYQMVIQFADWGNTGEFVLESKVV